MEKKIEVKDLRISFKTTNGKVQAVRGISFDLYKGETLAIVGESGSGKSVTSRALMGILAQNAMVEGGKIFYDGKDLLKISEEDFHKIRGDKIAMVFQDPLSSLNPIMRVGAQLTEAMLLKDKASRKESRRSMDRTFKILGEKMKAAGIENEAELLGKFKKFEFKHGELQKEYSDAYQNATETVPLATHIRLMLKNNVTKNLKQDTAELVKAAKGSCSYFVVRDRKSELEPLLENLTKLVTDDKKEADSRLAKIIDIESQALAFEVPNTFTLGYYLTFVKPEIPKMEVKALNEFTHKHTESGFMDAFIAKAQKGVELSSKQTDENRVKVAAMLRGKAQFFEKDVELNTVKGDLKEMKEAVLTCLDPLELVKDSLTHTFGTSLDTACERYFEGAKRNDKEERRFSKETRKHENIKKRGKVPEWEVIPASYIDVQAAREDIRALILEVAEHFEAQVQSNRSIDFSKRTLDIIDYLKENAQASVAKLTKAVAKERAIKLMESVGIDNPRVRFRQYPFEFSGGMRQRIVIAIALTADPDILICDEPTTALDVTIQAQILELINNLKKERNLSVIFITHDLGVVANMADRIAVMYAGKIVEYGTSNEVFYSPAHPYTWALLSSVPDLDTKEKLESIPGTPPNMIYPPKGDAFAPRNKYALKIDFEMEPPMFRITDTHYAATWLLHPDAPKMEMPAVVKERIGRMQAKGGKR